MPVMLQRHVHEAEQDSQTEDLKLAQCTQLCGILSLGTTWESPEERALWASCMAYMHSRGNKKALSETPPPLPKIDPDLDSPQGFGGGQ
jgi:hypothetical protein